MDKRNLAKVGVIGAIVVGMLWQFGVFTPAPPPPPSSGMQSMPTPSPGTLPTAEQSATTPVEMELLKSQQELQEKYVAALNELQMLRVTKDIIDVNNAIMAGRLATITSQKKIVEMLAPSQSGFAPGGSLDSTGVRPPPAPTAQVAPPTTYSVSSILELQNRWSAVLNVNGKNYTLHVGDMVPSDTAKVASISKNNVILEKDGQKMTLTLVSGP